MARIYAWGTYDNCGNALGVKSGTLLLLHATRIQTSIVGFLVKTGLMGLDVIMIVSGNGRHVRIYIELMARGHGGGETNKWALILFSAQSMHKI